MRPGNLDVHVADARHANEVVRTTEEGCERRWERNGPARRKPHCRANHHLLGDEVLKEAVGVSLLEFLAEGGVLDVAVERDDAIVAIAQLRKRGSVRFARSDAVA